MYKRKTKDVYIIRGRYLGMREGENWMCLKSL